MSDEDEHAVADQFPTTPRTRKGRGGALHGEVVPGSSTGIAYRAEDMLRGERERETCTRGIRRGISTAPTVRSGKVRLLCVAVAAVLLVAASASGGRFERSSGRTVEPRLVSTYPLWRPVARQSDCNSSSRTPAISRPGGPSPTPTSRVIRD